MDRAVANLAPADIPDMVSCQAPSKYKAHLWGQGESCWRAKQEAKEDKCMSCEVCSALLLWAALSAQQLVWPCQGTGDSRGAALLVHPLRRSFLHGRTPELLCFCGRENLSNSQMQLSDTCVYLFSPSWKMLSSGTDHCYYLFWTLSAINSHDFSLCSCKNPPQNTKVW